MSTIRVIANGARAWRPLTDPPGEIPSPGAEADAYETPDGAFTTGFWEREPDTWTFVRPYHEVALILAGEADIETDDGTVHTVRAGDVLITPKGSAGTWRIKEKIVKFYAIAAEPNDQGD
jgi:uncharacterized cupin superfamily protein